MNRPSTPPAAGTLEILAADIVSTRAAQLLDQMACGSWEPARKLREALATYAEVRLGGIVKDDDPQCVQINDPPAPETERSHP